MKNTGVCPKCGGSDILMVPSEDFYKGKGDPYIRGGLFATRSDSLGVYRYVCCSCGYVEQWIDPEELKRRPDIRRELEKRMENWREEQGLQDYWNQKTAEKKERDGKEDQRKDDQWN